MKNTKLRIILGVIAILMIGLVIFLVNDLKEEKILKDTINNYVENGDLPEKSKTTGEYHQIEVTILDFLVSLDTNLDDFKKTTKELEKFDYYTVEHAYISLQDHFKNDLTKLSNYEKEINKQLDKFIKLSDYDQLLTNFQSKEDKYYDNLYKELLGNKKDFEQATNDYIALKEMFDKYFDVASRYLLFLQNSSLTINEDKANMIFQTNEEVETYNKLIEEINKINLELDK